MNKKFAAALALASLLFAANALAEDAALPGAAQPVENPAVTALPETTAEPEAETAPEATATPEAELTPEATAAPGATENPYKLTTQSRWFVNQYRYTRTRKVTYYDDVYAVNHGKYDLTPFADTVPAEYFVMDSSGTLAVAPIVLDITDAMRERLYGGDLGETAMFYGQYCERIKDKSGRIGFSGIHEGIDFVNEPGAPLHAILGGEVTRAGDSNGTVGIYNEEYGVTLLYLHCEKINVRRGDVVEAGAAIAVEGNKNSGSDYTHVEMRYGRHTSSSAYRDTVLTSDCPYAVLQAALGVIESGRQPVTAAAVLEAQRMREEAEAAAKAAAEAEAAAEAAAKAAAEAEQNKEPEIELLDGLPAAQQGYGFGGSTAEPESTPVPEAGPVVDATLPPANP